MSTQYLMGSHLDLITALILEGIGLINSVRKSLGSNLVHSSRRHSLAASIVGGFLAVLLAFNIAHKFSMGFKSGLFGANFPPIKTAIGPSSFW